jgi:Fur family transcriptional regulator, iron response regulator
MNRPFSKALKCLQDADLRPTRQRLALAKILFDGEECHVTAEGLHQDVNKMNAIVSLATVYNTLHQFTKAGLLKEVIVDANCTYFDTNINDHHHIYFKDEDKLIDIPADDLIISRLPAVPPGNKISAVNVVVHMERN